MRITNVNAVAYDEEKYEVSVSVVVESRGPVEAIVDVVDLLTRPVGSELSDAEAEAEIASLRAVLSAPAAFPDDEEEPGGRIEFGVLPPPEEEDEEEGVAEAPSDPMFGDEVVPTVPPCRADSPYGDGLTCERATGHPGPHRAGTGSWS